MPRNIIHSGLGIMLLLVLPACSPLRGGDAEQSPVEIAVVSSVSGSFVRVKASVEGQGLRVTGAFLRMHEIPLPGHIDVRLYGKQGLLAVQPVWPAGLTSKRRGAMRLPFGTHFEIQPDTVRKVLLEYHAPAANPGRSQCQG